MVMVVDMDALPESGYRCSGYRQRRLNLYLPQVRPALQPAFVEHALGIGRAIAVFHVEGDGVVEQRREPEGATSVMLSSAFRRAPIAVSTSVQKLMASSLSR